MEQFKNHSDAFNWLQENATGDCCVNIQGDIAIYVEGVHNYYIDFRLMQPKVA